MKIIMTEQYHRVAKIGPGVWDLTRKGPRTKNLDMLSGRECIRQIAQREGSGAVLDQKTIDRAKLTLMGEATIGAEANQPTQLHQAVFIYDLYSRLSPDQQRDIAEGILRVHIDMDGNQFAVPLKKC